MCAATTDQCGREPSSAVSVYSIIRVMRDTRIEMPAKAGIVTAGFDHPLFPLPVPAGAS